MTGGIDLARVGPKIRAAYLDVYEIGYRDGLEAGRRQRDRETEAEWAALRAEVMPRLRRLVPYATLADLRGQHERAARQRETLRARGIA